MTRTRLRAIHVRELQIPFTTTFRHAAAERAATSTVWVEAVSADGLVGYGESCPRTYVTGETLESATTFIRSRAADLAPSVGNLEELRAWMHTHREAIDHNPAAWCAVELALLDLFAKAGGVTVEALLGLPELRGPFQFSAVLGDSADEVFIAQARRYRDLGFTDFKIKLSGERTRDRAKLDEFRRWNQPAIRVRADANNLWTDPQSASSFVRDLEFAFFALEEPIGANDYLALAEIAETLGCRIVLDESLLRADQIAALPGSPSHWIANIRVSKMGGLLRSLNVVEAARRSGIGIIVGAQVGETSLLTRAALSVAQSAGPALVAQEGAFGTHLLQRDVCDPPVMFGRGGVLDPEAYGFASTPGFGLAITIGP